MEQDDGHDWGNPRLDSLAIFYIVFAIIYTVALLVGLYVLYLLRRTIAVRLRSFWTICSTVLTLHIYLVLILIAYPLNGLYKCGAEFWIMSIVLPLGMALFQASNIRLLAYYEAQQALADSTYLHEKPPRARLSFYSIKAWWKYSSCVDKTYAGIKLGVVVQFSVSLVLFFGSRRFHKSYGFISDHVDAAQCRRGTEWIPSVFWQSLWATIFGPYVLLKIRNIHDTHYWAWQTRLALIACLPGTPLWLVFTYSNNSTVAEVNKWFIPAGWFLPGLFTMQAVSIIIPIIDAFSARRVERKLATPFSDSDSSIHRENQHKDYSMASLEMQIEKNVDPLLRWAAQKEFTAENIVFLREVRDFKHKWSNTATHGFLTDNQLRERYEEAALIYFTLVNPLTAKFNINLDYRTYNELEQMFAGLRYEPFADDGSSMSKSSRSENIITPWADMDESSPGSRASGEATVGPGSDIDKLYPLPITEIRLSAETPRQSLVGLQHTHIPPAFSTHVFDKAYESVKYDVFLNTWVRYEARFSKPRPQETPYVAGGVGVQANLSCSKVALQNFVKRASGDLFADSRDGLGGV